MKMAVNYYQNNFYLPKKTEMKKLFFAIMVLISSTKVQSQVLSTLPDGTASNNTHLAGVEIVGGVKTSYKYSMASLAALLGAGSSTNIGNTDLTLTGNRRLNFDSHGLQFFKVGYFEMRDQSSHLLFDINDTAGLTTAMFYMNYGSNFGLQTGLCKMNATVAGGGADNITRQISGSAFVIEHMTAGLSQVVMAAGAGSNVRATVDSATNAVGVTHLTGLTSPPAKIVGSGAGLGGTVVVSGTDLSGNITVVTGTSPAGNSIVARIVFDVPYAIVPKFVAIVPYNRNAYDVFATGATYVDIANTDATSFAISTITALVASTTYVFTYQVIQ